MRQHFADRLMAQVRRKRSQVVVGLDPRPERLPRELKPQTSDAEATARAVLAFNREVMAAVAGEAVAVKPQIAFYERLGCAGVRAYAETVREARERGLIVIADVKRGDISSTAAAYAEAHLGEDSDLSADAVTLNPYMGSDSVGPFIEVAERTGKGVFVLVKTSNPSAAEVQDLDCAGRPLHERVAELVARWGEGLCGQSGYSSVGAVVGATFRQELGRLRELMPRTPFLVPGYGAQGAGVEDVVPAFDSAGLGALVNSSRGIIFSWEAEPYRSRYGEERWREALRGAAADMRRALWTATHGLA